MLYCGFYLAFQKKLLPKALGRVAARVYFYPTLPFTFGLRWGRLVTKVDDHVYMGVAPVAFGASPDKLFQRGIRGVVNLCDEYRGPTQEYSRLGIEQLFVPTIDHHEPSLSSLRNAVSFIAAMKEQGHSVYVHCKAGHGRSAAVVFCWLVTQVCCLLSSPPSCCWECYNPIFTPLYTRTPYFFDVSLLAFTAPQGQPE